ncbi:MAG: hypothetical protein KME59_25200 [Trichormus sp. ATA11-4-KO1]|jgi:transposase-like protein|nr:hypothetical protein [Trichormus sp. ATA11-4-KO1]
MTIPQFKDGERVQTQVIEILTTSCPKCASENLRKAGLKKSGKQRYYCNKCQYKFVINPDFEIIKKSGDVWTATELGLQASPQGADDLAQRLKVENTQLKSENAELKQQLEASRISQTKLPVTLPENLKVTSLDKKSAGRSDISDNVKQQLDLIGIKLNATLTKTIKSASEETVLNAIEALKEAMASSNIEKPGAWLKKAIEEGWIPNEEIGQQSELDVFKEWYTLAYKKKLVVASQNTKNGIIVYTHDERWIPFSEMLVKYPLSTL